MKKYTLLSLFLFAAANSTIAQIGAKAQQSKIYGIWTNNDFGFQMTLMLNENGTGEFDGEEIKFTTSGGKLNVTQLGVTNAYTFSLANNTLTLSGGDLDRSIVFVRQGQTSESPVVNSNPTGGAVPQEILGVWSGYNETIEFKSDAQCIYRAQPFSYNVTNNHITLETAQGNVIMAYKISGNQLQLTVNGQNLIYTKGVSGTHTSAGSAGKSGGRIDQTIVGKWCYMNVYSNYSGGSSSSECITLKEDGTYEYYSESSRSVNTSDLYGGTASQSGDRGTWWVEGDRIYYNSHTAGQGSYHLEKRNHPKNSGPMIVLEGKTFVTFYNRPPW